MTISSGASLDSIGGMYPDELIVEGGQPINGEVCVTGFKHSLVTSVAAAVAADAPLQLENCPVLEETVVLSSLLEQLGANVGWAAKALTIDATGIGRGPALAPQVSSTESSRIHGSIYLMPALVGRFGRVRLFGAGGCPIGDEPSGRRPVRHYLEVFRRFGAESHEEPGGTTIIEHTGLRAATLDMTDFMSDPALRTGHLYSGATKAALVMAAMAGGTSVIRSPYPKPDVTDMVIVLRALGAKVESDSEGSYVVEGRDGQLPGPSARHELIPDLIEIITWICAGAMLADEPLRICAARMSDAQAALAPEIEILDAMGVQTDWGSQSCVVYPIDVVKPVDIVAASHGVFSDSQPMLALLAAMAPGRTSVRDTVWSGRFGFSPGLRELGVEIEVTDAHTMSITGPWTPREPATALHATDLRAAAVLLLGALATPGVTRLTGMHHLGRGYPDLPGTLSRLGARVAARSSVERPGVARSEV